MKSYLFLVLRYKIEFNKIRREKVNIKKDFKQKTNQKQKICKKNTLT